MQAHARIHTVRDDILDLRHWAWLFPSISVVLDPFDW